MILREEIKYTLLDLQLELLKRYLEKNEKRQLWVEVGEAAGKFPSRNPHPFLGGSDTQTQQHINSQLEDMFADFPWKYKNPIEEQIARQRRMRAVLRSQRELSFERLTRLKAIETHLKAIELDIIIEGGAAP